MHQGPGAAEGQTPGTAHDYRVIDPTDWRLWAVVVPAITLIGALVWILGNAVQHHVAELQSIAAIDPESAVRRAATSLRIAVAVGVGGGFLTAVYLGWLGVRVVQSGCVPPPGAWIVAGRPVYAGRFAFRIGRLLIALAALLAAASAGVLWVGWRLASPP